MSLERTITIILALQICGRLDSAAGQTGEDPAGAALWSGPFPDDLPDDASWNFDESFAKVQNCKIDEWTCNEMELVTLNHGEHLEFVLDCIHYDKYTSPSGVIFKRNGSIVEDRVHLSIQVHKIVDLSNLNQAITMDMTVVYGWNDFRIAADSECLKSKKMNRRIPLDEDQWALLWKPKVELDKLLKVEESLGLNTNIGLSYTPDGKCELKGRYEASVACELNFRDFPFDTQECHVKLFIIPPLNTRDETNVHLYWDHAIDEFTDMDDLHIPDFKLVPAFN